MQITSKVAVVLALLTSVFFVGVAAARNKQKNAPIDPKFAAIQSITVLPMVDLRSGKKESADMARMMNQVAAVLNSKNYPAVLADSTGAAGEIAGEDLEESKAEWIKRLGPPSDRWVMVVCLIDLHSKLVKLLLTTRANAELDGYLFDKETGGTIWKSKGFGQYSVNAGGQGEFWRGQALWLAVKSLLNSVPERPKPQK